MSDTPSNGVLSPPAEASPLVENRRVFLALPSYKTAHPKTLFTLLSLMDRRRMAVSLDYGDAFVAHSRNKLADHFLKSGMEFMLTCDDDMILPAGNAALFKSFTGVTYDDKFAGMHTLDRLLSHGKTLVGALYFGRWAHGRPVYGEGADDRQEEAWARSGPHDVIKPTRWVGTGCLLIHRSVFLDIEKKFPHLARVNGKGGHWFTSSEHDLREECRGVMDILDDPGLSDTQKLERIRSGLDRGLRMAARNGLDIGEDVIFCRRAAQSGHTPHVDCGLICGHVGEKVYAG